MDGDWEIIRHKDPETESSETLIRGAGEGFLISIFNPKIALFFSPQYLVTSSVLNLMSGDSLDGVYCSDY
ncbi:MAG: hypothetical protein CM1200mP3_16260 [Chloroflexota bacterium]|nr:MAG: hypothetical protein CM1200mP3_16260 [Chloroflexota bacterium]